MTKLVCCMELWSETIAFSPSQTMPSSRRTPIQPSFTQGIAGKQSAACVVAEAGEVAERWCALGAGVEGGFRC